MRACLGLGEKQIPKTTQYCDFVREILLAYQVGNGKKPERQGKRVMFWDLMQHETPNGTRLCIRVLCRMLIKIKTMKCY